MTCMGFYWVRFWDDPKDRFAGKWQVAQYYGDGMWGICGNECERDNKDVAQMGDLLSPPDHEIPPENLDWKPDYTNKSPLEMKQRGEIS